MTDTQYPSRPPARAEDDIDLLDVVGVLYRYRRFIIVFNVVVVGLALAFAVASLLLPPHISPMPNLYKPSAMLLVNDDRSSGIQAALSATGLGNLAALGGISRGSGYGGLAVRVLAGNSVVDTIVEEFGITERYRIERYVVAASREAVLDRATFAYDPVTSTLTVSYEDWDPEFARRVVDRFVEKLLMRFRTIGVNRAITERNLLQGRLLDVEAEIVRLEDAVEAFQRRHGVFTAQSLATEQVTMLAEVRSRLIFKELEIETYREFARMSDPVLARLLAERDNLRALLGEMEQGFNRFDQGMPSQQEIPRLAIEFARLERDIRVQARIYEILTQQFEIARLNAQGEGPIFQVLEVPDAPDRKSGPRRSVLMIAVTFGALFFSVVMVFILNAVQSVRRDPHAMRRIRGEE